MTYGKENSVKIVTPLALLGIALAIAVASAAAIPAAKQRVAIKATLHQSTFVLTPLQGGPVKRDSGTITEHPTGGRCRDVIGNGQKATICTGDERTLSGKRGTFTIRERVEWRDPGSPGCGVAFGTWTVVRGTGGYAGLVGSGRSAYDAHCATWYARYEGFLTTS